MIEYSREKMEVLVCDVMERHALQKGRIAKWKTAHGYGDEELDRNTDDIMSDELNICLMGLEISHWLHMKERNSYYWLNKDHRTNPTIADFPAYMAIEDGLMTLEELRKRLKAVGEDLSPHDLQVCLKGEGALPRQALDLAYEMDIKLDTGHPRPPYDQGNLINIHQPDGARYDDFFAAPYWEKHPQEKLNCGASITLWDTDERMAKLSAQHTANAHQPTTEESLLKQKAELKKEIILSTAPLTREAMASIAQKAEALSATQLAGAHGRIDMQWSTSAQHGLGVICGLLVLLAANHLSGASTNINLLFIGGIGGGAIGGTLGVVAKHTLKTWATKHRQTEAAVLREAYSEAINDLVKHGKGAEAEQKGKDFKDMEAFIQAKELKVEQLIDALPNTAPAEKSLDDLLKDLRRLCNEQEASIQELNERIFAQDLSPDRAKQEAAHNQIAKEADKLDLTHTKIELHPILRDIQAFQLEMGPHETPAKQALEDKLCSGAYDLRNPTKEQLTFFTPRMLECREAQISESGPHVLRHLERVSSVDAPGVTDQNVSLN